MTASALDYSMLVVSGVDGVQRMTREHLAIALALQVCRLGLLRLFVGRSLLVCCWCGL